MMGLSTNAAAACCAAAGLVLDPGARELPDHISIELGFLHYLSLQEAIALRQGDGARVNRGPVGRLLGAWVQSQTR